MVGSDSTAWRLALAGEQQVVRRTRNDCGVDSALSVRPAARIRCCRTRCSVRDKFLERVGVASATAGRRRALGRFGSVGAWPRARRGVGAGARLSGAKVGCRHSRRQATWGFGALRAGSAEGNVAVESTGTAGAAAGSLQRSATVRSATTGCRSDRVRFATGPASESTLLPRASASRRA